MAKLNTGLMGIAAGAAMLLVAGSAAALDSSVEGMEMSGTHQFYVWCTGADDYEATADGSDWKDAQANLYGSLSGNNCWPVWQGLVD